MQQPEQAADELANATVEAIRDLEELLGPFPARVYGKGSAALLHAREVAGAEAFDAGVHCYVDATAWTIATPEDLPEALEVLTEAGALDAG